MPLPLLLSGLLTGMLASPEALAEVRRRIINGLPIVEHLDEDDSPCNNRGWQNGCYVQKDGEHHVWYSEITPQFTKDHEISHARGMRHGPWVPERDGMFGQWRNCAVVFAPADHYEVGDKICVTDRGETRYPANQQK